MYSCRSLLFYMVETIEYHDGQWHKQACTFLKGVTPHGLSSCSGWPEIINRPAGSDWTCTWFKKKNQTKEIHRTHIYRVKKMAHSYTKQSNANMNTLPISWLQSWPIKTDYIYQSYQTTNWPKLYNRRKCNTITMLQLYQSGSLTQILFVTHRKIHNFNSNDTWALNELRYQNA